MRRVLVAIDFSKIGRFVLGEAAQLARRFNDGEVHVLHVASLEAYRNLRESTEIALDEHLEHLRSRLRQWAGKVGATGVPLRIEVIPGDDVADSILATAEQVKAELLVMGSHSRTGIARVVLGSVAESVLRRAQVPVLIIPRAAFRAEELVVAGAQAAEPAR